VDDTGAVWQGFVYDSKQGTAEEFLPSFQTIANAINAKGQVAGNVFLEADAIFPGSAAGIYGFVREADGAVRYLAISQGLATRARSISESCLAAGYYVDPVTFERKSYVTSLSGDTALEVITLADDEILFQKPCDPNLPAPPGAGYELFTDVAASQVRNDGTVVGSCVDTYVNPTTGDLVRYGNGFVATPAR
jgi:hypothetical protein